MNICFRREGRDKVTDEDDDTSTIFIFDVDYIDLSIMDTGENPILAITVSKNGTNWEARNTYPGTDIKSVFNQTEKYLCDLKEDMKELYYKSISLFYERG